MKQASPLFYPRNLATLVYLLSERIATRQIYQSSSHWTSCRDNGCCHWTRGKASKEGAYDSDFLHQTYKDVAGSTIDSSAGTALSTIRINPDFVRQEQTKTIILTHFEVPSLHLSA
ncbi:hypothetical protein VTO58DRAFT_104169 [Aureobasidium pullulans]